MGGEKTETGKTTNSKHALILCGFGFHAKISDCKCLVLIPICLSVTCPSLAFSFFGCPVSSCSFPFSDCT